MLAHGRRGAADPFLSLVGVPKLVGLVQVVLDPDGVVFAVVNEATRAVVPGAERAAQADTFV